jgi:hypothetical protein
MDLIWVKREGDIFGERAGQPKYRTAPRANQQAERAIRPAGFHPNLQHATRYDAFEAQDASPHLRYDSACPRRLEARSARNGAAMSRPVIFTISAAWDQEASVWSGHCDDIPAAADAPTLDGLLEKISAMALDLLPDNHPDVAPESLFLQITALREAEPAAS